MTTGSIQHRVSAGLKFTLDILSKQSKYCSDNFSDTHNKHYDWFALVNKYFRGKIMQTSLAFTEVWPISDRIIRQKYYCITVHYRIVCTSENLLGQTV